MKKKLLLLMVAWLPLVAFCDQVTVNVETEGTLEEVIASQDVLKITELKIIGRITAEDIIYLRQNIGKGRIANLETLDLKDVTLVASETPYYKDSKTGEFYLSEEEIYEDETRNSSVSGGGFWMEGRDYSYTYYYGMNLPYAFTGMPLKNVVLPLSVHKISTCCFGTSIETVSAPGGIKEIDERAFSGCGNLVSIPSTSSVTSIGFSAFSGCNSLTNIDLSNTELIGESAFSGCSSLTTIGNLGKVSQMGKMAFMDCKALKGVIDLSGLSVVPYSAFANCEGIENLTFSDKLIEIREWAFSGCKDLTALTLPEGLVTIATSAFKDCNSLTTVTIPSTLAVIDYTSFQGTPWLENHAIDDDGMMCINNVAIRYFIDTDFVANSVLTFKEGIIGIGDGFQICWRDPAKKESIATENIIEVKLPSTLQFIGKNAFNDPYHNYGYCYYSGLKKIVFPASLKKIGADAFYSSIESISFAEGLEEIGPRAFVNCSKLEDLKLPSTLKRIGENAFGNCTGLSEITIPENVENLNYPKIRR